MQCIFCKGCSDESKSVEHIIPESLGNKDYVLPKGVVCDKCNNYFATNIEKKLLEMPYFLGLRHYNLIENKKGSFPRWPAFMPKPRASVEYAIDKNLKPYLIFDFEDMCPMRAISQMQNNKFITISLDRPPMPEKNNRIISRFLGKVGIEVYASRIMSLDNRIEDFLGIKQLDSLREYVRYNKSKTIWKYHVRRIYDEEKLFMINKEERQVLHEFNFLYTEDRELYFVLVIMGVEYCLNMGGTVVDGYIKWLYEHGYTSPLYLEGID